MLNFYLKSILPKSDAGWHRPMASLVAAVFLLAGLTTSAQPIDIPGPPGSITFGSSLAVLSNGNFVVIDPNFNYGGQTQVGAVHLYDGSTLSLISTLRGSKTNDQVASGGIVALDNGNFLVSSPYWHVGATGAIQAGAVTWINGKTGLSDTVSLGNSLVGISNSYHNGYNHGPEITILRNGNFVVVSSAWRSLDSQKYGAATWGNRSAGIRGNIDSTNSLIGLSQTQAFSANPYAYALTNGNYVVISDYSDRVYGSQLGAVTWGNGTTGTTGVVDTKTSLIGAHSGDKIGHDRSSTPGPILTPLANGNYVIGSANWDNDTIVDAGAATWADGTRPITGHISPSNSLLGTTPYEEIGDVTSIRPLPNGNYVVLDPRWSNGIGAATWADGTTGITGQINASNSLVGSQANDQIGSSLTVLENGNYVVQSPFWVNALKANAGAATWGDASKGISGIVSSSNSLVGDSSQGLGSSVIPLANGNYVVTNSFIPNGSPGAMATVTWGDGSAGTTGKVSVANSVVGTPAAGSIGTGGVWPLANGNYVVVSPAWNNGNMIHAGAVTWCNGSKASPGLVSAANSLVGAKTSDSLGSSGLIVLPNGNFVVKSTDWDNGNIINAGAATWVNGKSGMSGLVTSVNSLVGSSDSDYVGRVIPTNVYRTTGDNGALSNGNYVLLSGNWHQGSQRVGAATWPILQLHDDFAAIKRRFSAVFSVRV